jgi:hypothetical protein
VSEKPVWMEEWQRKTSLDGYPMIVCGDDNAQFNSAAWQAAELAAAAPALVRALLMVEWCGQTHLDRGTDQSCPFCRQLRGRTHYSKDYERDGAPACAVNAALDAAGFVDAASRDAARERMKR